MHNTTAASKLESALDELHVAQACAACSSVRNMAANPEQLEWWLNGLMSRLKTAIGRVESVITEL